MFLAVAQSPDGISVANRYRLMAEIGHGPGSTVWHAHDEHLVQDVAIKELRLPATMTEADRSALLHRLLREARTATSPGHPASVRVHDVVAEQDRIWIIMDPVVTPDPHQLITESGALPPEPETHAAGRPPDVLASAEGESPERAPGQGADRGGAADSPHPPAPHPRAPARRSRGDHRGSRSGPPPATVRPGRTAPGDRRRARRAAGLTAATCLFGIIGAGVLVIGMMREQPGTSRDRTAPPVSGSAPVTASSAAPEGLETNTLVVRAAGDTCKIFVARPGNTEVIFDGVLTRGQILRYDLPRMDLVVRDASACQVWINGSQEPVGLPGERKDYTVEER
jgi:hypothetical protein